MASAVDIPDDDTPGHDNIYGAGRIDISDILDFLDTDISSSYWNAPTILNYQLGTYTLDDEPMWVRDPAQPGRDWFRLFVETYRRIRIYCWTDPNLSVNVYLLDKNRAVISQVLVDKDGYRTLTHVTSYTGKYYVKVQLSSITGDEYYVSGDYYKIKSSSIYVHATSPCPLSLDYLS